MRFVIVTAFLVFSFAADAAEPDKIYNENIHSVQLFLAGNPMTYPVIQPLETNKMQLEFDDLTANIDNYYYAYQLCDANWEPVDLSPFDYVKGFTQNRLSLYRVSSIASTKYIHYSASLPERNSLPSKTGNYLLKVFRNGDTAQLAFTKRFLVTDNAVNVAARMVQAFNPQYFRTHHKIQFTVDQTKLNVVNVASQIKVVVMQNWRWDNAKTGVQPTFIKGNLLEYSGENEFVFPAGSEYKWLDIRSFRYQSDRVASVDKLAKPWTINVYPDKERTDQRYIFNTDHNGFFEISTTESLNPYWQTDYANVRFTFIPSNHSPYADRDVFIGGQFNNYEKNENSRMVFNSGEGVYEKTLLLKQGYYNYCYLTQSTKDGSVNFTDQNFWDTENEYTVLVYYKPLSGRSDELISVTSFNSKSFVSKGIGF